ncbi:MAG: hypothetical protein V4684_04655 [Pseudomonadota bacterium]
MYTCYACGLLATSREHVPPKNLFPERKDIPQLDLRQDLITVPSCDLHNLAKSQDDEFLMVSLAGLIGNNAIGYRHNMGKVDRAVRRSASRLLMKAVVKPQHLLRVEVAPNRFVDVLWGTPDVERLRSCFDAIVRGLHFHDFGIAFVGKLHIHLAFLHHEKGNAKVMNEFLRQRIAIDVAGKPKLGANPLVFYYQRSEPDQYGLFAYRLCFYGVVEVLVGVWPASAMPPENLVYQLIARGMPTRLALGSAHFDFNTEAGGWELVDNPLGPGNGSAQLRSCTPCTPQAAS